MEIDMFAYKIEPKRAKGIFQIDFAGFSQRDWRERRVYIWRNHSALDKLMHMIFKHKGGKGMFNCSFLQLSLKDLKIIERIIRSVRFIKEADKYCCYFNDWLAKDLAFIAEARQYIKEGYYVYYYCWW